MPRVARRFRASIDQSESRFLASVSPPHMNGEANSVARSPELARRAVGRLELLHALGVVDLAGIDVALGVGGDAVDPVEVAGVAARPAEAADHLAVAAAQDAQQVVLAVDVEQ